MPNDRPHWLPERKPFDRMKRKNSAFYNSRVWRAFSERYKWSNPLCRIEGCNEPTAYTDHIKPVNEGGALYDTRNLQPLCITHNASKTGKQQGVGGIESQTL